MYINIIKAFKNALKEREERLAKLNNDKKRSSGLKRNKKKKIQVKSKISSQTIKKNGLSSVNECSNKTSTITLKPNGNVSSSSRSQSITCSLSSIADTQDKTSIDKISADSGAYLNGDNFSNKTPKNNLTDDNKKGFIAPLLF